MPSDTRMLILVSSLLVACWLNSISLIFSHSKSEALHKKEVNRAIFETTSYFDDALGMLHDEITCLKNIQDGEALAQITKMIRLHNELSRQSRLSITYDQISEFLINYHMKTYIHALHNAFHDQRLPLPSGPRMEVAIKAIHKAKREVLAINTYDDHWYHTDKARYHRMNIDIVKSKHLKMKRIFIFSDNNNANRFGEIMKQQAESGIEVRIALQEKIERSPHGNLTICNLLICDHVIMTHSISREKHDGFLVLNKDEIDRYAEQFWIMWDLSDEYRGS